MRLAAWLLAAGVIALVGASPAGATWSREQVASTGIDYGEVALAANERGDAALLFDTRAGLSLALARAGRDFGRPRALPRVGDDSNPSVAVDEQGNVLVAWNYNDHTEPAPPFSRDDDCCERIQVILLPQGSKRFSGPKTLGQRGTDAYLEAFSLVNGRIGIAWSEGSGVVARVSRRGLRFGPTVRAPGEYALAVFPARTGPVLTFERSHYAADGIPRWSLWDLVLRSGRPPTARKLFSRHADLSGLELATNARGGQALAWSEGRGIDNYDVFAGARSRGGRFHPRRLSGRASFDTPRVSIGRTGAAVVGWEDRSQVFTADRRPGRAFGNGIAFTARRRGVSVDDVQVAANAAGRAVIAWRQQTGQGRVREHAALRTRGGRRLSARSFGGVTNFASFDTTALDRHGVARVAWANGPVYAARAAFPGP